MELPPITITGLAEFAEKFPDDRWYELKVRVRKTEDGGAEIRVDRDVTPVEP